MCQFESLRVYIYCSSIAWLCVFRTTTCHKLTPCNRHAIHSFIHDFTIAHWQRLRLGNIIYFMTLFCHRWSQLVLNALLVQNMLIAYVYLFCYIHRNALALGFWVWRKFSTIEIKVSVVFVFCAGVWHGRVRESRTEIHRTWCYWKKSRPRIRSDPMMEYMSVYICVV